MKKIQLLVFYILPVFFIYQNQFSQTYYSEDFEGLSTGAITTSTSANIYIVDGSDHACGAYSWYDWNVV